MGQKHASMTPRTGAPHARQPHEQRGAPTVKATASAGVPGDLERGEGKLATATLVAPVFGRRNSIVAGALFVVALLMLLTYQVRFGINPVNVTQAPQYIYQAESFLHGHWDVNIPHKPGDKPGDIVVLHGKQYVAYPPFPALLLMPFVAVFGLATSDVLFTAVVSALIAPLLFLLFEQLRANGLTQRPWIEHVIFSLFCYFGTITLWLSLGGTVWYTGHIVCMACTLLALLLAFRRHYTWAAVLLSCAFLSRFTAALGFPFLFYLAWQDGGMRPLLGRFAASLWARRPDWTAMPWRRLLTVAAVMTAAVGFLVVKNIAVFGSPLETGYNPLLQQTLPDVKNGLFSLRYVPGNILADFFHFPRIVFQGPFDRHPALDMLDNGGSLVHGGPAISVFATTPLFLLLFWRNRSFSQLRAALWLTIGLVVVVMLPYQSVGWYQFGARYLYEAYPYAFLLLMLSEMRLDWRVAALGLLGIVVNALGAHQVWTFEILHL